MTKRTDAQWQVNEGWYQITSRFWNWTVSGVPIHKVESININLMVRTLHMSIIHLWALSRTEITIKNMYYSESHYVLTRNTHSLLHELTGPQHSVVYLGPSPRQKNLVACPHIPPEFFLVWLFHEQNASAISNTYCDQSLSDRKDLRMVGCDTTAALQKEFKFCDSSLLIKQSL